MQFVFVQLKQEHYEHEQSVDHEKREHRLISQFDQVRSDSSLFVFVFVDRVQIFVDQISPELLFRYCYKRDRTFS